MTNEEKELVLKIVKQLAIKLEGLPSSKELDDYDAGFYDGQRKLLIQLQKELIEQMD